VSVFCHDCQERLQEVRRLEAKVQGLEAERDRLGAPEGGGLMRVHVTIPGPPLAQGRARVGRNRSGNPVVYDPKRSKDWKGSAAYLMTQAARDAGWKPTDRPVQVQVAALYPCPKSDYRKRTPRPARWHTKRGDVDNIAKAVLDAGNGVLWLDDASVVDLRVGKAIAAQGQPPAVEVTAWWAPPANSEEAP